VNTDKGINFLSHTRKKKKHCNLWFHSSRQRKLFFWRFASHISRVILKVLFSLPMRFSTNFCSPIHNP